MQAGILNIQLQLVQHSGNNGKDILSICGMDKNLGGHWYLYTHIPENYHRGAWMLIGDN